MTGRNTRMAFLVRLLFPVLAVTTAVLGMWGFLDDPRSLNGWHQAVIKTLQLFLINVSAADIKTVPAQIASLLAPAATIGAASLAFGNALRKQFWLLRLRFFPASNLFLGNGDTAAAIAMHLIRKSDEDAKLDRFSCHVGMDCLADTPLSQSDVDATQTWFFHQDDARSPAALRRVNAGHAGNIWILTGNDMRNLEIARRISEICRESSGDSAYPGRRPRLLIAVNDRGMIRVRRTLLGEKIDIDIELFSIHRMAARALFLQYPPQAQSESVSIAVVGDGPLAEAIVVQAATHLVYSDKAEGCIRICLIGKNADALLQNIRRSFPALDPAAESDPAFAGLCPLAKLVVCSCEAKELQPARWIDMQQQVPFSAIYVAGDDDLSTAGAAMRIAALRDLAGFLDTQPIVVCLKRDGRSADVELYPEIKDCFAFKPFDEFRTGERYPGEARDRRAKLVHFFYSSREQSDTLSPDSMIRAADDLWRGVSYEERWSSRLSADHFEIKLAILGINPSDLGSAELLQRVEEAMPMLARIEHRRFIAERLLDGWLPYNPCEDRSGPVPSGLAYKQQKAFLRLNQTLVAFETLPEIERAKDHAVIRAMCAYVSIEKAKSSIEKDAKVDKP